MFLNINVCNSVCVLFFMYVCAHTGIYSRLCMCVKTYGDVNKPYVCDLCMRKEGCVWEVIVLEDGSYGSMYVNV